MSYRDSSECQERLKAWLLSRRSGDLIRDVPKGPLYDKVTIVMYFFRGEEGLEDWFELSKRALFETWACCGRLRTVIVTNAPTSPLSSFAESFENVSVQVEEALRVGDVNSLSEDCSGRLYHRFNTDYVLTVQDDGFPLRSGLEEFVGKYDFIGAPCRRRNILGVLGGIWNGSWLMNGGFSLRSKRFCETVAQYWNRYYADKPFDSIAYCEDRFCTCTLPTEHREFFRSMRWPFPYSASRFSYGNMLPMNITKHPFGFHSAYSFCELSDHGVI